jgi:ABC-type dipeptide/oligopeptide/nickel transport system permease subunit
VRAQAVEGTPLAPPAGAPVGPARSPFAADLRELLANRTAVISIAIVVAVAAMALFAPWIAAHDPYEANLLRRLQPPVWLEGGEWAHPSGCDQLGRDILSRIVYGARVSMTIGLWSWRSPPSSAPRSAFSRAIWAASSTC